MSFYTVQDCIMGFPGYLLLHCLTSARVFPSAAAPFPTPRFSLSFSLTFLHLSPFYSFCLPNTLWPFDPLLTSLTHLLKGDDQHISCELSISDGFILISGHLTCLLSLCAGMVQFVLMRLNGNKKDEVEKLKLNDSFGNSNWKIQRKWVSVPHFWCKIWGRPLCLEFSRNKDLRTCSPGLKGSRSPVFPLMMVTVPVSEDFQHLGISFLIWPKPNFEISIHFTKI